jgi:hypothetical protein
MDGGPSTGFSFTWHPRSSPPLERGNLVQTVSLLPTNTWVFVRGSRLYIERHSPTRWEPDGQLRLNADAVIAKVESRKRPRGLIDRVGIR